MGEQSDTKNNGSVPSISSETDTNTIRIAKRPDASSEDI